MTWEADLGSQIIAGVISAGLLATVLRGFEVSASVRRNDALVRDLNDDLRRWIIDRDRRLRAAMTRHHKETPRVDRSSSTYWRGQAQFQAQALQDWRDEATRKRRDYARIVREEDGFAYRWARFNQGRSALPVLDIGDGERRILDRWRADIPTDKAVLVQGVHDITQDAPDLLRFEREGDPVG